MSSGKGGKSETTVKLPKDIEDAAKDNLQLAQQVGSLPYAPYFGGSVAAFTPAQQAGFGNMNDAASAFGLQGNAGTGMPKPQNFGGISGYSTESTYKDAMQKVDPKVLELFNSFFYPNKKVPATLQRPTSGSKSKPSSQKPTSKSVRTPGGGYLINGYHYNPNGN